MHIWVDPIHILAIQSAQPLAVTILEYSWSSYHPPTKLRKGNIFSRVCVYLSVSHGGSLCRAPTPPTLVQNPSHIDMFKLDKLGPHCTQTLHPHPQTYSNLFTMNHWLSSSGRMVFDWNALFSAFLFGLCLLLSDLYEGEKKQPQTKYNCSSVACTKEYN